MRKQREWNVAGIGKSMLIILLCAVLLPVSVSAKPSAEDVPKAQVLNTEEEIFLPEEPFEAVSETEEPSKDSLLSDEPSEENPEQEISLREDPESEGADLDKAQSQVSSKSSKTGIFKSGDVYKYYENGDWKAKTGVARRASDGRWLYVKDGIFSRATGFARRISDGKWMYIKNGVFRRATGFARRISDGKWMYAKKGFFGRSTGFARRMSDGKWMYAKKGFFSRATGVAKRISDGKWMYAKNGFFKRATGIDRRISDGKWMYVRNGFFKRINGLGRRIRDKKLLYVEGGIFKKATGIVRRIKDRKLVYVKNGIFKRSTGLAKSRLNGKWLYVENGVFKKADGHTTVIGDDSWVYFFKNGKYIKTSERFSGIYRGKCYKRSRLVDAFYKQDWIDFLDDASGAYSLQIQNGEVTGKKLEQLKEAMQTYYSRTKTYGFIAVNTETGLTISYNADESLFGASTIKAPYIASLCKYDAKGISRWKREIYRTLQYSDNDTYASLFYHFGKSPVYKFMREANVKETIGNQGYRYITARELAKLWCVIKDYLNNGTVNVSLLENNLLYHKQNGRFSDYYKKGWMDPDEWSGGILNCGGSGDDWVYAIVSSYRYSIPESAQDALVAALKTAVE